MSAESDRHYDAIRRAMRAADGIADRLADDILAAWERIATGDTPVTNAQRVQFLRDVELITATVFVSAQVPVEKSLLYQVIRREAERVYVEALKVGLDELDDIMKDYEWWPDQRQWLINAPMTIAERDGLAAAYKIVYGPHIERQRLLNARLIQPLNTWKDTRGYTISDRIWRQGRAYRDAIDRTIRTGIQQGWSADRMARELRQYVKPGYAPVRYTKSGKAYRTGSNRRPNAASASRRLARTEITRVHGDSTKDRARDVPGVKGIRWRLSHQHPEPDQCDNNAYADNYGLGEGVYPVDAVPTYPDHPNDLCTLVTVHWPRDVTRNQMVEKYRAEAFAEAGFDPERGYMF